MRLKDGEQVCPKCQGAKCYWCRRTGKVVQCPVCMNQEHELFLKDEDEHQCLACGARFIASGELVPRDEKKPSN